MRRMRGLVTLSAVVALGPAAPAAHAQYFGRNKVQYERFEFRVLKTEHFDVYYYVEEREAAELMARMAERWYWRLSQLLDHELRGRQPLILYASHPQFQQTNAVLGTIGEGTGGVTEAFKRRIVLPLAGPLAESDHVLGHELVHAFQFDMTGTGAPLGVSAGPGALQLPLWLIEGMAEYFSVGAVDPHTAMWMRDAVLRDELPTITQLDNPKYFPYRWGQALWAYIGGRWGDEAVVEILRQAGRRSRELASVFPRVLGLDHKALSEQWHASLRSAYAGLAEHTTEAAHYGRAVITEDNGGELNIAPSLSPDGRHVVFFSERDLFSIDMFLADARTGEIRKKLTKTAVDPHFESLQFINSSGTWSPDGTQFAFGAIARGRPVLTIVDVERGATVREVRFESLGEIFNPAWSPDGRSIAFSAIVQGLSDLFVYELEAGELRALTDDPHADLQPAWTPDGRIVFVTDRFGAAVSELRHGHYRLAVLDPGTGEIRPLSPEGNAKQTNPQVTDDGKLYFLSDAGGITNIYRLDLQAEPAASDGGRQADSGLDGRERLVRLTNLATGVSGITALSPALSAAREAGSLAFSVYSDGNYVIHVVDDPGGLAPEPLELPVALQEAGVLPPRDRGVSRVAQLLAGGDASVGDASLPPDSAFTVRDYSGRLSLDYVAPPTLAVAADRYGTYFGGGSALFFSDMLGNRNLATAFQVQGSFDDVAALVAYSNVARRWNWGLVGQQVPLRDFRVFLLFDPQSGNSLILEQRFRQINRQVAGLLQYPLSRVQRLEFTAGYSNISYSLEHDSLIVDQFGRELRRRRVDVALPSPFDEAIHLGQASAALVYDNSFFGATSPILGQRYRFEATPTIGTLTFGTALADVRKYVMPVRPFTLAGRVLHFGRYGSDAEDGRLFPLFLGYQSLMRGYDVGSFNYEEECRPTASSSCPVFDQLFGSRLAVANVELRFPLFGLFGIGGGYYGFFPIETALFADAGVAWTRGDEASFLGGPRNVLTSWGVAARINLFGFAIIEADWVNPSDRPSKGAYFQFGFTPGF